MTTKTHALWGLGLGLALGTAAACSETASTVGGGGEGGTPSNAGSTSTTGGRAGTGAAGGAGGDGAAGSGGASSATGGASPIPAGLGPFGAYPSPSYPTANPDSEAKRLLGKVLFWEEQMSSNNQVACGTCHRAGSGGSDPRSSTMASIHPGVLLDAEETSDDRRGSMGLRRCTSPGNLTSDAVFGTSAQVTKRKAPSYLDAMFAPALFWDGRATSRFVDPHGVERIPAGGALESQAMGPPVNDVEMGCEDRATSASEGWTIIEQKLAGVVPLALASNIPADMLAFVSGSGPGGRKTYLELFQAAFPDATSIEAYRIAFAIATHERSLRSNMTPWDRFNQALKDGDVDSTFLTTEQKRGLQVFNTTGRCNLCHMPPLFTDSAFHNLGFVEAAPGFDTGRQEVTTQVADRGKVKTPTLRNVALRAAGGLLHTGTEHGASLDAVMAAYNVLPNLGGNVDPIIAAGGNLGLSEADLAALVAFMEALTDPRVEAETAPFDRPTLSTE